MLIEPATLEDISYLCHLQRLEARGADGLGFVPRTAYEDTINQARGGQILVATENEDRVGFIYSAANSAGVTKIYQVAVQDDARRLEIGTALVDSVTDVNGWLLSLRCRENLPAIQFWQDLGFTVGGVDRTPNKRKSPVIRFHKVIGGLWV